MSGSGYSRSVKLDEVMAVVAGECLARLPPCDGDDCGSAEGPYVSETGRPLCYRCAQALPGAPELGVVGALYAALEKKIEALR